MANRWIGSAIGGLIALGAATAGYVLFTAAGGAKQDSLKRYAVGEMKPLRVERDPPSLPRTAFAAAEGEASLPDLVDRVTLVNLWATWCAPCVAEMPALNRLQSTLGSERFQVIAISLDRTRIEAQEFYDEQALDALALYHDPSLAIGRELGAIGLPISVLYGADGVERGRLNQDAEWDSPEAVALIEALIAESYPEVDPTR